MGYSISHWNPYEKMTKDKFLESLARIDRQVSEYEKNANFAKHIVPEKLHEKIMGLADAIKKGKDFYAYYQDARALYEAFDFLNKQDVFDDPAKAAQAYGRLFRVLGSIAAKNPNPLISTYGQIINMLGQKFETLYGLLNGTHGDKQYDSLFRDPQNQKNY
ncbi:MAG: hypothetical protein LH472_06695 [Pyrinomonadaceae bacterium]|nr:hypothetical protein [Pyrinomonadaceae bacterium]